MGNGTLRLAPMLLLAGHAGMAQAANIPFFPIDTAGAEYKRFVAYVDHALGGNPDYGFSPYDAMLRYSMGGDAKYADFAVAQVDAEVASEETLIAAGKTPDIAGDSYLYVGEKIAALALAYDWASSRLTAAQKTRWKAFADQAIYNVWNPAQAAWGGASKPWSGWSIGDPGNNYHYSFLRATMYWAVASQNQAWLDFVRAQKAPPLAAYFARLPGGGSLEGTGYGTSHKGLFEIYGFWKSATGTDLSALSPHCANSIDYWIHATVPTLQRFAPIGDQARVSDAPLYDYQRALVERAVLLNPGTQQAARGTWWLENISVRKMSGTFNLRDGIFTLPDAPRKPTALAYHSPGVGDLFARASWDTGATWVHLKAGLFDQSHAHQDQGSIGIYNRAWLAVTENMNTHSGIEQGTEVHNVLLFTANGGADTVGQEQSDSAAALELEDDGAILTANADLSCMYRKAKQVLAWRRSMVFDRPANVVTVRDTFAAQAGVGAAWQLNTPAQPVRQGDSIVAGALIVKPLDGDAEVAIAAWNQMRAGAEWKSEYLSGWKITLTRPAGATAFAVRLRIDAPSTWKPASIRDRAAIPPGRSAFRLELRRGRQAMLTLHMTAEGSQAIALRLYDARGRKSGPTLRRTVPAGPQTITWPVAGPYAECPIAILEANGARTAVRIPGP
jgi:hypothetical protein